jgi:hypothetical protein
MASGAVEWRDNGSTTSGLNKQSTAMGGQPTASGVQTGHQESPVPMPVPGHLLAPRPPMREASPLEAQSPPAPQQQGATAVVVATLVVAPGDPLITSPTWDAAGIGPVQALVEAGFEPGLAAILSELGVEADSVDPLAPRTTAGAALCGGTASFGRATGDVASRALAFVAVLDVL